MFHHLNCYLHSLRPSHSAFANGRDKATTAIVSVTLLHFLCPCEGRGSLRTYRDVSHANKHEPTSNPTSWLETVLRLVPCNVACERPAETGHPGQTLLQVTAETLVKSARLGDFELSSAEGPSTNGTHEPQMLSNPERKMWDIFKPRDLETTVREWNHRVSFPGSTRCRSRSLAPAQSQIRVGPQVCSWRRC